MNADAHFVIGKTHKVCEDYAIAGEFEGQAFAIVSDGCSSSPDTDFGSRLMARAAVEDFSRWKDVLELPASLNPERCLWQADTWRKALGLNPYCLDATLLMAFQAEREIRVFVTGDGVVAARKRGSVEYHYWAVRYPSGAPGYLSYLLDPKRLAVFIGQTEGTRLVEHYTGPRDEIRNIRVPWGAWGPAWTLQLDPAEYDLVAVMSDGAESFQREEGGRLVPVPLWDVLDQVMSVKGAKGQFITRRLNRFLTRFCVKNGWQHYDDFGVAALAIPDDT